MKTVLNPARRRLGFEDKAREVMVAENEYRGRQPSGFGEFFWYHIFGRFIGFSYEVWNALYASFLVIFVGYVLFRAGKRAGVIIPTKSDTSKEKDQDHPPKWYPTFSALVYSLETFLPLVKLGVAEYWMPNSNQYGPGVRKTDDREIAFDLP